MTFANNGEFSEKLNTNRQRIQVLDRAFNIIELLALSEQGSSLTELAKKTGLPKSTVYRILTNLRERHYIEKNEDSDRYVIGYKFIEIASVYLNKMVLKTEAVPIMRRLSNQFQCISYLGILESNEVMYLEKIEPNNSFRLYREIGKREPLYCTGLGKVLLSGLPETKLKSVTSSLVLKRYTENTITDLPTLLKEVQKVQQDKYAVDRREHQSNNACLAMPIYDFSRNIMAAMSISKGDLFDQFSFEELHDQLQKATHELSKRMGYTIEMNSN